MTLRKELQSRNFWRSVMAEITGTLIFILVVLGASSPGQEGPTAILQIALAAGFSAVSLNHCFGEISGAQINPAITLAFLCTRKLDFLYCISHIVAQCLGAIMATGILFLLLPNKSTAGQLVSRINNDGNAGQALSMEIVSTFQLVFTIFAVEEHRRREVGEPGSMAIGCSLAAGMLAAGRFSGGSMNPARSFGPAVIIGSWDYHWVYWLGPMLGAVLAGISYEFFFASSASREKLVACITCKDIEIVETVSVSQSSLSFATQSAIRAKQANKHDNN
ncbi:aquaporin-4-like [Protopterus annectens]|uniref:aquaporin-4-like n=1 Tax=Protopterus annectens TaxID=7888 RepID=UPI001CF9E0FB|nr:aquaporin-4-like [Protopterus annectens]